MKPADKLLGRLDKIPLQVAEFHRSNTRNFVTRFGSKNFRFLNFWKI